MNNTIQTKARHILIVDDNPAIHGDFRKVLGGGGQAAADLEELEAALFGDPASAPSQAPAFEIDSAYQGQEGVELVRVAVREGRPYALAFIDVRMPPGIDGIMTAAQMWKEDPNIQIVICTAYSDYSWEETATQLGRGERWLIQKKPFDSIEIRQIAHALTEKWTLMQQAQLRMGDMQRLVAERTRELGAANDRLRAEMAQRERVEVELRHAQKLEAVGQLASGIAHEINTPVQFIGDSVHFLQEALGDITRVLDAYRAHCRDGAAGELPAPLQEIEEDADLAYLQEQIPRAFERTLDGINRVATIVRAMKEFAHPSQKEQAPADLNRALQSTLTVARNEYKYVADIDLRLGDLPLVTCDVADLNQVFLNLIVNASHAIHDVVKGSEQRGTIRVESRHEGESVIVSISDTGTGIPEAVRGRIFDPFFTTKEVGRGTGQGLAIARSIVVDRHGGRLTFDTEIGRGTTFHIALPIAGKAA